MPQRAYLDHNAGSPIRPEVMSAVADALGRGANPSSIHAEGRASRVLVEQAREAVAALVGAQAEHVVFTSGGTEANATVLRPGALVAPGGKVVERLVRAGVEHASVVESRGFSSDRVALAPVGPDGTIDQAGWGKALDGSPLPALASVQVVNSETGIVQPVAQLAEAARRRGHVVHSDAVQAAGKLPLDMTALGIDALTLSGHKLGAPAGIGALVVSPERTGPGLRFIAGGSQEDRRRGGTENLAGIVGFGVAAESALRDLDREAARLRRLRDRAEKAVRRHAPAAVIFGENAERAPHTVAFAVPGLVAETALMALDLEGIAVSSGSACSSGKVGRSHVLAAMGVPEDLARGAIRLSFGWNSTDRDIALFERAFEILLARLYERGRARAA